MQCWNPQFQINGSLTDLVITHFNQEAAASTKPNRLPLKPVSKNIFGRNKKEKKRNWKKEYMEKIKKDMAEELILHAL